MADHKTIYCTTLGISRRSVYVIYANLTIKMGPGECNATCNTTHSDNAHTLCERRITELRMLHVMFEEHSQC